MTDRTMKWLSAIVALCLWGFALPMPIQAQAPIQAQSPKQAQDYDHSSYMLREAGPFGRDRPLMLTLPASLSSRLATAKPKIPLTVIKDIQRIRPGMTRADLDWLFIPDGGVMISEDQAAYIYRYAAVTVTSLDAAGKPMVEKTTLKPLVHGESIKIDVKFKRVTGNARGMARLHPAVYPYGTSDDVIISVSDPYVAMSNEN